MKDETFRPNRMLSYFQEEWKILFFVTVSGLIYNLGLLAGPWFEGKMTGKLVDLLGGTGTFHQMLMLVTAYVVSIGIVQVSRYFKRFYVRRFANNVNRHMKQILYGTLVRKSRLELKHWLLRFDEQLQKTEKRRTKERRQNRLGERR